MAAPIISGGVIASIRLTFFIFAVSPGREITTSFPRSNPEWRRSRVSAVTASVFRAHISGRVRMYDVYAYAVARARA